MSTGGIEVGAGIPRILLALWGVSLVLLIVLMAIWIGQELGAGGGRHLAQEPRKPCHGCSDADLGLVVPGADGDDPEGV